MPVNWINICKKCGKILEDEVIYPEHLVLIKKMICNNCLNNNIIGGNMKLYFMNTTIIPNDGVYSLMTINLEKAKSIWSEADTKISAIGHKETVLLLQNLGFDILENRIMANFDVGDEAICLKLKSRIPEGQILTAEEIEKINYDFKLLERIK